MKSSIWRRLFSWFQRSSQTPIPLEPHRMKKMKRDDGKRKQLLPWTDALDQLPREWQIVELSEFAQNEATQRCRLIVAPHAFFLVQGIESPGGTLHAGLNEEKWQLGSRVLDNPFLQLNDLLPVIRSHWPAQADLPVLRGRVAARCILAECSNVAPNGTGSDYPARRTIAYLRAAQARPIAPVNFNGFVGPVCCKIKKPIYLDKQSMISNAPQVCK